MGTANQSPVPAITGRWPNPASNKFDDVRRIRRDLFWRSKELDTKKWTSCFSVAYLHKRVSNIIILCHSKHETRSDLVRTPDCLDGYFEHCDEALAFRIGEYDKTFLFMQHLDFKQAIPTFQFSWRVRR